MELSNGSIIKLKRSSGVESRRGMRGLMSVHRRKVVWTVSKVPLLWSQLVLNYEYCSSIVYLGSYSVFIPGLTVMYLLV